MLMWRIILAAVIFLSNFAQVSAGTPEENEFNLKEALAKFNNQENLPPSSVEVRFNKPEVILRHKNFSLDYSKFETGQDLHYVKLNVDNQIISLLGTGADWTYGVTGIFWKADGDNFSALPTLGLCLRMKIMAKLQVYSQHSGISLGGHGHIYDAESGFRYSPSKNFTLTAGYRHINAKVRHGDNRSDFHRSKLFLGVRTDF